MALYNMTQLIDKTLVPTREINFYKVADINNLGDKAKPAGTKNKNTPFVLYSYLLPTEGHTSDYGIKYAKRTYPYFVFRQSGVSYGIPLTSDKLFSLQALKDQGALSVKEEIEARKKAEEEGFLDLPDIFKNLDIGKIVQIGLLIFILALLAPFIFGQIAKIKTAK